MTRRTLVISQGAYAALCECKVGDNHWDVTQHVDKSVEVTIESTVYDLLVQRRRELGARDLSDVILLLYRNFQKIE